MCFGSRIGRIWGWIVLRHDDGEGDVQDVCQFSSLGNSSMKAHLLGFLHFSFFHIGPLLYLITSMVILSHPIAVNSIYMLMPKLTFP